MGKTITKDALEVFRLCGEAQFGYEEYRLLERMLGDQTKDGQLKPNAEISPQSLHTTEKYKEYARKRNGVEGIPSILGRRYGIDRMPVRGLLRSKMWFGFKIGAINVKRVIAAAAEGAAGASPRPTSLDYSASFCFLLTSRLPILKTA